MQRIEEEAELPQYSLWRLRSIGKGIGAVCGDAFEAAMDARYTIALVALRMLNAYCSFIVESRLGTVKQIETVSLRG